jgi:phenylalanyl-tRNA synthetase beta subunit
MWVGEGTDVDGIEATLRTSAGNLLVRLTHLDTFTKAGRTSLAFRLVFQASDHTLTEQEITGSMDTVYKSVAEHGWEVR